VGQRQFAEYQKLLACAFSGRDYSGLSAMMAKGIHCGPFFLKQPAAVSNPGMKFVRF